MIKSIKEYINSNKYLCVAAVIFLLVRVLFLDQLFLLHDERDIVFSGYSIAKTAQDLFGNFLPINFSGISPDNPLVSIYYSAASWILLPIRSVFFARIPFVLISTLLIFLVYEIILQISRDKRLALVSSLVFVFSPWVFHVTRLALDLPLAAVTLFSGLLLFLKNKRWLAYFMFFLTFYNYQGFRVLIPFLIIYLEIICHTIPLSFPRRRESRIIVSLLFVLFLFLSITFIDKSVTTKRFSQVAFLAPERFTQEVNLRRSSSNAPLRIQAIFHNKISVTADYVVDNFIKGQDISYLFKTGDFSPINGNAVGGQFFFGFLLFYYLGIMALGKRLQKEDFYILGFIILGLLPAMASVNSATYSIRGFLSALGYAYLLSLGILFGIDILKRFSSKQRTFILVSLLLVFIINSTYFIYNYYVRRPVTVGELFNENERRLATYLIDNPDKTYTIYHNNPKEIYLSYLFLNNNLAISQFNNLSSNLTIYQFNNFTFIKCPRLIDYRTLHGVIVSETCMDLKSHDQLNNSVLMIKKIPYKDISLKTAYFIFE
ncbi:hypothetical protein A3D80_01025 [Candidatus Roizmanbacteria bacterium RIFCSPHIGHO2_02_FULL_40_13b]|uniref:Glycosyltransferase RgtA/B/C/D-like domain-containing protein n=1 Tax=Candidatus Roizmanbacteria bacterium RIFCSPHIGHO2_01_FULL_39_24 TaxID=1802032 RepID=A0A1F7GJ33_9BACT|nr:MAG: hypothetical protein A2799_02390 [Candidatus Roizmanbacteria bacterium RIFCSPHIGHO2_01_FULL_39_24]OGK26278.1 MAG: hypothetical protein A3D80_01025 [Candidatus Roizmanbacteria bacterium RIFCSPHIGHO2_02_FULL_40_13b]OGK48913.1 MAG: hypothetical protein A3A56_01785 [Candidatus Roizmanbacteria bacterium RIFCSPLOWO2_01_FULL_40_32]